MIFICFIIVVFLLLSFSVLFVFFVRCLRIIYRRRSYTNVYVCMWMCFLCHLDHKVQVCIASVFNIVFKIRFTLPLVPLFICETRTLIFIWLNFRAEGGGGDGVTKRKKQPKMSERCFTRNLHCFHWMHYSTALLLSYWYKIIRRRIFRARKQIAHCWPHDLFLFVAESNINTILPALAEKSILLWTYKQL